MAEKPPFWTLFDHADRTPLMLSRDIDISAVQDPAQDANVLAEQLAQRQQVIINRFVARQRQLIELGEKDVHSAVLPLDGMDVYYTHVQGLERMHYHVRPEAIAPVPPLAPVPPPVVPEPVPLTIAIPDIYLFFFTVHQNIFIISNDVGDHGIQINEFYSFVLNPNCTLKRLDSDPDERLPSGYRSAPYTGSITYSGLGTTVEATQIVDGHLVELWTVDVSTLGGLPDDLGQILFFGPIQVSATPDGAFVLLTGGGRSNFLGGTVIGAYLMVLKLAAKDGSLQSIFYTNQFPESLGDIFYAGYHVTGTVSSSTAFTITYN